MKLTQMLIAITASLSAMVGHADSGDSSPFLLDTAEGIRIAAEGEAIPIAYSPRWGNAASCTIDLGGSRSVATTEGTTTWTPSGTGAHTLTHTASDLTYTARFTVPGDDVVVHSGTITANEVWESNKVHLVVAPITLGDNNFEFFYELEIQPGAIVKFMPGTGISIASNAYCRASGAIFTHVNDDTIGGDTLMDGDETVPVMDDYSLPNMLLWDETTELRYYPDPKLTLSGTISEDETWRGHNIYCVTGNLTVASGKTLTIMPGAIVKVADGLSLTVNGILDAQGTRAQPIVFTSIKDDEHGGDTNGDGEMTYPYAGDWGTIIVSGVASFNYVSVLYGGSGSDVMRLNSSGTINFDNSELAHAGQYAVDLENGKWRMSNSIFRDFHTAFRHWATSFSCVNSVFYDCIYLSNNGGQNFTNCIISRYVTALCWWTDDCTYNHCVIWNPAGFGPQSSEKVGSNGNIWGDPKFVDAENGDFRLQKGSPCVNAGDATNAPEYDYYGQPRDDGAPDIGIYEMTSGLSVNDLAAVAVNAQAARSTIGEALTISYEVANVGKQVINSSWRDKVSLVSADGGYSLDLGTTVQTAALAVGATNMFNASFTVPPEAEGIWRVQVGVNVERDVYEGTNVMNNVATSAGTVEITLPARAAADGFSGTAMKGKPASAKFALDGTEPMVARINAPAGTVVYLGNGFMPSASSYSARAVVGADGGLIGIPAGVTSAYILVETTSSKGVTFTMTLESAALAVQSVTPTTLPYTGTTGLVIDGANFAEGCAVVVERAAGAFGTGEPPVLLSTVVSPTRMTSQIDCSRLTAGATYDVKVVGPSTGGSPSSATATLPNALTVANAPAAPKLKATLDAPASVRRGRTLTVYIDYENVGNADLPAPIFELISEGQVFKIDGAVYTNSVKVMGLSAEAPVGTLRPGEPQRIGIPVTILAENVKWKLKSYHAAQASAKSAKFSLRELYDDDWVLYSVSNQAKVVDAVRKRIGSTHADYYRSLSEWISEIDIGVKDYASLSRSFAKFVYLEEQLTSRVSDTDKKGGGSTLLAAKATGKGTLKMTELSDIQGSVYKRVGGEWKLAVSQNGDVLQPLSTETDTYIICHGNGNDINEAWVGEMADAISASAKGAGANVLAVDWGELATVWGGLDVFSSAYFVPYVALMARVQLGILGVNPERTTLIGHSHGAHLAGRIILDFGNGTKFARMVGLDTSVEFVHGDVEWTKTIRDKCRQVEFYKSSWTFSMTDKMYGHYNFAVVGDNDFTDVLDITIARAMFDKNNRLNATKKLITTKMLDDLKPDVIALAFGPWGEIVSKAKDLLSFTYSLGESAAGFSHEKYRHSMICSWFTTTIKSPSGCKDIGFNFEGDDSWQALCGGTDIRAPGEGKLVGVINGGRIELLSGIRNDRMPWRYEHTVLNQADSRLMNTFRVETGDTLKAMEALRNAVAETFEYDISGVALPEGLASKAKISFNTKDNADNASISFDELEGEAVLDFPERTSAIMWLVDLEGLADELHDDFNDNRQWNYSMLTNCLSKVDQTRYVREIGCNMDFLSSLKKPSMIIPKFMNDVFDAHRPLYTDGVSSRRRTLLVLGVGVPYDDSRITFPEHDLYPDNNFVIREVVALPSDLRAVISKVSAAKKSASLKSARLLAAPPTHQLSANALKPGEVVQVKADKNGNWSIALDCTESYTTADEDEIVFNRFELTDVGNEDGVPRFQNNNTICDVERVTVSGMLPTATDADGNPVCEGKRYTVQLTVAAGDNEDDVTTCVLDVRAMKDDDPGEDEDDDSSNEPKSCDPNEMVGDEGVGEQRFVKPGQELTYTIYFENKSDADAAAACVEVLNPLSDALDWSSLVMLDVGYNNNVDNGLSGLYEGWSEKALEGTNTSVKTEFAVVYYDEEGNVLDENALAARSTMEGVSARAEWYLRIIDPNGDSEGWPLDMTGGFLLPNDPETHCGEGYIRYKVKVREDAPGNTIITNSATIIFDHYNDPIETDPAWWNTVGTFHEVSLEIDGVTTNLTLIAGEPFGELPQPAPRNGYTFEGWFTGKGGTGLLATSTAIVPSGQFSLYAFWTRDVGLLSGDVSGSAALTDAATYDGYLHDGEGNVKGTVQVKVSKPKNGTAKVTAAVSPLGGKKATFKGTLDVATGRVSGMDLTLGAHGMSGTFGGYTVDGVRSQFASKDKAEQSAANALASRWSAVNVAWRLDGDGSAYQTLSVSIGKKGKAKVSGVLASGAKVSATGQLLIGEEWMCVPVSWAKKGESVAFSLWLPKGVGDPVVVGLGDDVAAGSPKALRSGAAFGIDVQMLCALLGDGTYAAYLPDGASVSQAGAKWIVAGGAKAGKVQLGKDGAVDEAKAGANPSGLKLTCKAKDGSFKGSFKAYVSEKGKPKAATVSVTGVMVGDEGYGSASIKKKGSVPIWIK